jgi:hypothetical protein
LALQRIVVFSCIKPNYSYEFEGQPTQRLAAHYRVSLSKQLSERISSVVLPADVLLRQPQLRDGHKGRECHRLRNEARLPGPVLQLSGSGDLLRTQELRFLQRAFSVPTLAPARCPPAMRCDIAPCAAGDGLCGGLHGPPRQTVTTCGDRCRHIVTVGGRSAWQGHHLRHGDKADARTIGHIGIDDGDDLSILR